MGNKIHEFPEPGERQKQNALAVRGALYRDFENLSLSIRDIARGNRVSECAVVYWFNRWGFDLKDRDRRRKEIACKKIGAKAKKLNADQKAEKQNRFNELRWWLMTAKLVNNSKGESHRYVW